MFEMGIFDEFLFDLNGDDNIDAFEFALAMCIMEDEEKEEQESNSLWENDDGIFDDGLCDDGLCDDGFGLSPDERQ